MATFDIDEFLRLEGQGQAAAAAPATPASPSTPTQPKKSFGARFLKGAIPTALLTAAGEGAASQIGETSTYAVPENRTERALKILSGADIFGIGAALGRLLTGRSQPAEALKVPGAQTVQQVVEGGADVLAGGPSVVATPERGRAGYGAVPRPVAATAPVAPAAVAEPSSPMRLITGDAGPVPFRRGLAGFYGATARLRGIEAGQKAQQQAALKLPALQKDLLESALLSVRLREAEKARVAGSAPSAVSAIAAGRATGEGSFAGFPDLTGQYFDILNRQTGAVTRTKPKVQVSEQDIQATMKANKMTREQVIARLKAEGRM